jgi:PEGA domain
VSRGATDVATAKELRSTTLQVGGKADPAGGPAGAAVRLLEPDRYRGTIRFTIDVKGATVYVNGTKAALSAKGEYGFAVGTQAVRVTHPEYRDFVRFVDVPYASTVEVPVNMTQYARIDHDIQGKPVNTDQIIYIDPPWWRRPYVYGPVAVVLAVGVGILVGTIVHNFPDGECRKVGGNDC